jgi:hypothetical protein
VSLEALILGLIWALDKGFGLVDASEHIQWKEHIYKVTKKNGRSNKAVAFFVVFW